MLVFLSLTKFFSVGKPSQKYSKSKKSHRKTIKAINTSLKCRRTIFFCFIQVFFSSNLPCKAPQIIQCNLDILSKTIHLLTILHANFHWAGLSHRFRACGPCRCKSWMNHYARGLSSPTWNNIFGHFVSLQPERRSRVDFWNILPYK